jgi:hypothetical protein
MRVPGGGAVKKAKALRKLFVEHALLLQEEKRVQARLRERITALEFSMASADRDYERLCGELDRLRDLPATMQALEEDREHNGNLGAIANAKAVRTALQERDPQGAIPIESVIAFLDDIIRGGE